MPPTHPPHAPEPGESRLADDLGNRKQTKEGGADLPLRGEESGVPVSDFDARIRAAPADPSEKRLEPLDRPAVAGGAEDDEAPFRKMAPAPAQRRKPMLPARDERIQQGSRVDQLKSPIGEMERHDVGLEELDLQTGLPRVCPSLLHHGP